MRLAVWWLTLASACYSPSPAIGVPCGDQDACPTGLVCAPTSGTCEHAGFDGGRQDADEVDAPDDAARDATFDAQAGCYGVGLISICPVAPITEALVLTTQTLHTGTSPLCLDYTGTSPGAFCVIAGTTVSSAVGTLVSTVGPRPLVIVSTSTMTIDGMIDVASHRSGGVIGAGANDAGCPASPASTGSSGGAGGSFGSAGGTGGSSQGTGAPAAAASIPTTVRGGCRGSTGAGLSPGGGGNGGGAIALIATQLEISGTVNASGSGGEGGSDLLDDSGGGGGGSGGMILLDAATITITASGRVFANGGGGGEGSGGNSGIPGADPMSPMIAAPGGSGAQLATGNGGPGSVGSGAGQSGISANRSGGGGGGGAGVIRVFPAQVLVGQVSPPAS
ncbi:MAG: virulence associated protein [Myxococcales bacterium]|nr:virulence associated protein [Myxococcales bacterium]